MITLDEHKGISELGPEPMRRVAADMMQAVCFECWENEREKDMFLVSSHSMMMKRTSKELSFSYDGMSSLTLVSVDSFISIPQKKHSPAVFTCALYKPSDTINSLMEEVLHNNDARNLFARIVVV